MQEIGLKFKKTRESMEISLEEAAEDLNLLVGEIDNLEKGNIKFFDNVPRIKELIEIYGKYLGLHYQLLIDEFNEYLFDYTSKISLQAVKKADKKTTKDDKLHSPYTIEKPKNVLFLSIIIIAILVVTIILFYFVR